MFSSLSPDVALYILSYLSLTDVIQLYTLSHSVNDFLQDNESAIYHQLAILHRFVSPGVALTDAVSDERSVGGLLDGVTTWKELCQRWGTLQRNWSGSASAIEGGYLSYSTDVRKFRVDEEERAILAVVDSSPRCSLSVRALEDGRLLWSLPTVYTVDISEGYLLLRRDSGGLEIWKRANDVIQMATPRASPLGGSSPLAATPALLKEAPFDIDSKDRTHDLRGSYLPHGFLPFPAGQPFRINRLRSTLLAVVEGGAPHTILLYDIEQGILLRSFDLDTIIRENSKDVWPRDFVLFDVDISAEHLCACFHTALVVVPLQATDLTGPSSSGTAPSKVSKVPAIILVDNRDESSTVRKDAFQLADADAGARSGPNGGIVLATPNLSYVKVSGVEAMEPRSIIPPTQESSETDVWRSVRGHDGGFLSARFSPDGRHLMTGTVFNTVFLLPDFSRVLDGTALLHKVVERLRIGEPVRELLWDVHKYKIVIRTEPGDILIIDLNPRYYTDHLDSTVSLSSAKVLHLRDFSSYGGGYGTMQVRRTGLWLVWDLAQLHGDVRARTSEQGQTLTYGPGNDGQTTHPTDVAENTVTVCFIEFANRV